MRKLHTQRVLHLRSTDQDSVRLLAVECCGPLAKLSGKDGVVQHILPIVQKFSQVSGRYSEWLADAVHNFCADPAMHCMMHTSSPSADP